MRDTARRLTLQYVVASTIILLVSGVFGLMLRDSQANVGRLGTNTWYALMTAHGLGAFLGWAGFAVMGFAFWILQEVGFELRRFGLATARLTWWLMVVGVGGILVSTIVMHFAGSWVFLYPIPFHSAGQWGKWATAIFLSSVLLVGLSIVTWCLSIIDTVIGPGLHAVSTSIFNRLGVAMGFGYLWPKRFATNPEQVPYVVIPLTVIAIDMIVATLPLAVLLVEMIVQTFAPSVHVSALLAKNVLWWFGHPVVYQLLFPAVAIYYYLVPKLANRKLVAGNVIAIAWVIAVIANVLVFAHHVYLDYPAGTAQATINTAMQPITFALTIPSALSLYSLFFTIYRSDWKWTGASTALFLGLVSWLTAGLSGVVNATIAFDVVVHNTLWVVGHFHHMALLNIGFAIFGAIYYFIPELTGRALYSDLMARWHIWLTFVFGLISFGLWLVQGLEGAPRRYAVLPHRYLSLSQAAIPFVIALGLTQLLFVYNIVQTMRGAQKKSRSVATAEALFILAAVGAAIGIGVIGFFLGRDTAPKKSSSAAPTVTAPAAATTTAAATTSAAEAGKALFVSSCGSCHTLKDAGTSGAVGPNLDDLKPSLAVVAKQVTNGGKIMPSFKGSLTPAQIQQVAAYVSSVAGK